jgi:hypothetical protein
LLCLTVLLGACSKKPAVPAPEPSAAAPAPAPVPTSTPAPVAEPAAQDTEKAKLQAKLDYSAMEDGYLNDAKAQWAVAAKASSSYGEKPEAPPEPDKSLAHRTTSKPDGNAWSQLSQDVGFDWIQADFANPVQATELRAVFLDDEAVKSITKVELISTDGKPNTVWSGLSDQVQDARGARTWFVRKFDKTPYQVKAVKLTFANNVATGYKEVDAVQLVGE